jgi:hypothetical protein
VMPIIRAFGGGVTLITSVLQALLPPVRIAASDTQSDPGIATSNACPKSRRLHPDLIHSSSLG